MIPLVLLPLGGEIIAGRKKLLQQLLPHMVLSLGISLTGIIIVKKVEYFLLIHCMFMVFNEIIIKLRLSPLGAGVQVTVSLL